MSAEMGTSEVLNKAADLIEQRGWTQGTNGWGIASDQRLCLEGGILAATGMTDYAGGEFRTCPAFRAVRDYLVDTGKLRPAAPLFNYNDRAETTAEDVIGVLRATALIESARERESVEV